MANLIHVLDPVAPFPDAVDAGHRDLDGVRGKVFGFIDNSKPNFGHLVADLEQLLTARYGAPAVLKHTKIGSSVPAGEAVYREFAERCDVVITGSGD